MQSRKICFVATESEEGDFFAERFAAYDPDFCDQLSGVPADVGVLSVFIGERIDRAFIESHPHLRFIATRSTGCDHIDKPACRERNISVACVSGYGENTVAEHTFALILALSRRLRESTEAAFAGRFVHEKFRGMDLRGRTLGVIGAGRVGMHVIRIASAFGLRVLAFDEKPQSLFTEILEFRYTSLETLLRESDVITLHVPLNEHTYHLINRDALRLCKQGLLLINTARGGLVDSDALLEALDEGRVGGAGLDVLEEESVFRGGVTAQLGAQIADRVRAFGGERDRISMPPVRMKEISRFLSSSALLRRPQVVFTPHNAYNSDEARAFINRFTAENIEQHLAGKIPDRLCV